MRNYDRRGYRRPLNGRRIHESEDKVFEVSADITLTGTYYVAAKNEAEAKKKLEIVLSHDDSTQEGRDLLRRYPYFFMNHILDNPYAYYGDFAERNDIFVNGEADEDVFNADIR